MIFFIGFAIGQIFLPSLSDKYGRKKMFLAVLLVVVVMNITLLVFPAPDSAEDNGPIIGYTYFYMFIIGVSTAARVSVGYCFMNEFMPAQY